MGKDKHKKKKKHHRHEETARNLPGDAQPISSSDYFAYNLEFTRWLNKHMRKNFDQLDTDETHKLFDKFVRRWNSGRLDDGYYSGEVAKKMKAKMGSRTSYQWNVSTTGDEQRLLDSIQGDTAAVSAPDKRRAKPQGPAAPDAEDLNDYKRQLVRKERKDFRQYHKEVLDELAPKATGREARIEKRKLENFRRKQREESPDMDEKDVMGGSDFQAMMSRRRIAKEAQQARRREEAKEKVERYKAKEQAQMASLLEMARAMKSENALWKT